MRIGIVGFGPVGQRIAAEARRAGHDYIWYDPADAIELVDGRVSSLREIGARSALIMAAVPSSAISEVASVLAAIRRRRNALILDWSSAAPTTKLALGGVLGPSYVDVALLDSVTAAVPQVCVAGIRADGTAGILESLGFRVLRTQPRPGQAAQIKLVRSLFMKPLEVLSIEALRTAAVADPTGAALLSISGTLGTDIQALANMLLETNRDHASRRAVELEDAIATVSLESGASLFGAAHEYLTGLAKAWTDPGAPGHGAPAEDLIGFLVQKPVDPN
jgi:3-hydroxyisobutyrate dehydrogenase-like beta-hydroxyacid dehydrogenase